MFALISSISSVSLIFLTLVHFLREILVHFTSSCCVSWTVSPEVSIFQNASIVDIRVRVKEIINSFFVCFCHPAKRDPSLFLSFRRNPFVLVFLFTFMPKSNKSFQSPFFRTFYRKSTKTIGERKTRFLRCHSTILYLTQTVSLPKP